MDPLNIAVRKYDPDFVTFDTVAGDSEWSVFDGLAVGDWIGSRPKPTLQQLLTATTDTFQTVEHWYRHGIICGLDYLQMREKARAALASQGGFEGINNNERRIAARLFLLSDAQRFLMFPSISEQIEISSEYHEASTEARTERFKQMEILVFSEVADKDYLLLVDQMGDDLITAYKRYGVMGIVAGDAVTGILDYVRSTAGTRFENNGLAESGARCRRITLGQLAAAIHSVLSGVETKR